MLRSFLIFADSEASAALQRTRILFDEDGNASSVTKEEIAVPCTEDDVINDGVDNFGEEQESEQEKVESVSVSAEALTHRAVPSHFYPEAKARNSEWCGTHTRFADEDEASEPTPVSEEMVAAIDALGQVSITAKHNTVNIFVMGLN